VEQVPVDSRIEITEGKEWRPVKRTRSFLPTGGPATAGSSDSGAWLLAPLRAWPITGYQFPSNPSLLVISTKDCSPPRSDISEKRLDPNAALEYSILYRYLFDMRR
jgi:hypothetical protein